MSHEVIGGPLELADGTVLPLSKAIRAGDFVFLSGQLGLHADGHLDADISAQAEQCINNIKSILGLAGLELQHVIKATVWLTDMGDFKAFNAVYAKHFANNPPVRSTVCSELALPAAKIEIEVTAYAG